MADKLKEMKDLLTSDKKPIIVPWDRGLNSGSTLLNLACSGRSDVSFLPGGVYLFVGDSSSGKTFLVLTAMAEASINPIFNDYQLVFDNVENGALMDIRRFFGKRLADRMIPPKGSTENPIYSTTVESLYYHICDVLDNGPAIYIVDSMDALTSDDEEEKFEEMKEAFEKDKTVTGTYGTSKAKANSGLLRVAYNKIKTTGSIFFLISQTRDNIGFGAQFNPKTRSGGRSLTFYSQLEIWSSVKSHEKATYKGKERELGVNSLLHVKKNRLVGKDRKVMIPILHSHGLDDLGSIVDWLVEEKFWKVIKGTVTIDEWEFTGNRDKLIQYILDYDKESELKRMAKELWDEIEEAIEVKRSSRYNI